MIGEPAQPFGPHSESPAVPFDDGGARTAVVSAEQADAAVGPPVPPMPWSIGDLRAVGDAVAQAAVAGNGELSRELVIRLLAAVQSTGFESMTSQATAASHSPECRDRCCG